MVLGRILLALAGLLVVGFVLAVIVITHWSTTDRERIQTTIVTTTR